MLNELFSKLQYYNTEDLLSTAGALQLLSQNAERIIRLEAFAFVVACLPLDYKSPLISINRLKSILNTDSDLSTLSIQEDPCDNLLTEEFTFFGGSYTVFPGIVENPMFILKNLSKAIFLYPRLNIDKEFKKRARYIFEATLTIGNIIAKKAGLKRYIEPSSLSKGQIYVPQKAELEKYKVAVTFERKELLGILQKRRIPFNSIELLIENQGTLKVDNCDLENLALYSKPLVAARDRIFVLLPSVLLASLRHHIICLAKRYNVIGALSKAYRESVWHSIVESLGYLGNKQIDMAQFSAACLETNIKEGLFDLDLDKAIYVQFFSDDLTDYDENQVYGKWDCKSTVNSLETLQRKTEEKLFSSFSKLNEIIVLIVIQGIGRWYVAGVDESPPPYYSKKLLLLAADLEQICLLEGGNKLILWQYATAHNDIRKTLSEVVATSLLDEFHYFRKGGYSYYCSDKARPDFIWFSPGGAIEICKEISRKRDFHGVPSFTLNGIVEVTNLHDDTRMSIYTPMSNIGQRITLLLEGLPILIWVLGPEYQNNEERELHSMYAEFADMITYWLWQFTPSIYTVFESFRQKMSTILFNLKLEDFFKRNEPISTTKTIQNIPLKTTCLKFEVDIPRQSINLKIFRTALNLLYGADNTGERYFMKEILKSIREFAKEAGFSSWNILTDDYIESILDKHAPVGIKKKLLILNTAVTPLLDNSNLPSFRKVQKFNENLLLDEVGEYLTDKLKLKEGNIPDGERVELLHNIVDFLFKKLTKLISSLKRERLLEELISFHERFTYERAFKLLTMPTRIACFGNEDEMTKMFKQEFHDVNKSARAIRFLIEYISAIPPNGSQSLSYTLFDELQAVASEIINWAFLCDLIYYRIADIKLSILPSKRLGSMRKDFEGKYEEYITEMMQGEIIKSHDKFYRHWMSLSKDKQNTELATEINTAFQSEWRYSFDDMAAVVREIYAIGLTQIQTCKKILYNALVEQIKDKTELNRNKIIDILENLSLQERSDFWNRSKDGKRDCDVYPWRFNREKSFMRKPLIGATQNDNKYILWGNRHLQYSIEYLFGLFSSGKLKAKSNVTKSIIGQYRKKQGEFFNDEIYDLFKRIKGIITDKRVKKIGKIKIQDGGKPLGDLDVLVIHLRKKRILIIECKNLNVARTPYEMHGELEKLFVGENSIIQKHQKRIEWVKNHFKDVLSRYQLSIDKKWKIESVIVIDNEIFSTHLYSSKFSVFPKRKFMNIFLPKWQ